MNTAIDKALELILDALIAFFILGFASRYGI